MPDDVRLITFNSAQLVNWWLTFLCGIAVLFISTVNDAEEFLLSTLWRLFCNKRLPFVPKGSVEEGQLDNLRLEWTVITETAEEIDWCAVS